MTKYPLYIHYNAYDFNAPDGQHDTWSNYQNPDSAKMFLACGESWRRNGWMPRRLNSRGVPCGFKFTGALETWTLVYPLELWNVWFALLELAPCWLCCTDVLNYGFSAHEVAASPLIKDGFALTTKLNGSWSTALCFVTPGFCLTAIRAIKDVDTGIKSMPQISVVSDEACIRDHCESHIYQATPSVYLAYADVGWERARLVHYPRSILQRALDGIAQYPLFGTHAATIKA